MSLYLSSALCVTSSASCVLLSTSNTAGTLPATFCLLPSSSLHLLIAVNHVLPRSIANAVVGVAAMVLLQVAVVRLMGCFKVSVMFGM
ncbi:unnamed protein product [Prunus armeniaca]